MSTTKTDIRKQAKKGIDRADDTTVKMVLAMLTVHEQETGEDAAFEQYLLQGFEDYEQGKIKPITFDELVKDVRSKHKKHLQAQK